MNDVYSTCEQIISDIDFTSVRDWKDRTGGKAVGYFPVYAPSEIIHAAGINTAAKMIDNIT